MILTAEKLAICEQARNHLLTFLDEGPELHPCESESYSGANYLSVCAATLYGISVFKKIFGNSVRFSSTLDFSFDYASVDTMKYNDDDADIYADVYPLAEWNGIMFTAVLSCLGYDLLDLEDILEYNEEHPSSPVLFDDESDADDVYSAYAFMHPVLGRFILKAEEYVKENGSDENIEKFYACMPGFPQKVFVTYFAEEGTLHGENLCYAAVMGCDSVEAGAANEEQFQWEFIFSTILQLHYMDMAVREHPELSPYDYAEPVPMKCAG